MLVRLLQSTRTSNPVTNPTMKTLIIVCLASASFALLPGCTTVEEREPAVHTTTTTEESTVHRASPSATETRTIRSY